MIRELHKQVLDVLRRNPSTRNSDSELHCVLLRTYYDTDPSMHSYEAIVKRKDLPKIESVGRARRKVQELHPDLRADADIEAGRMLLEEEFIDYSKSVHA